MKNIFLLLVVSIIAFSCSKTTDQEYMKKASDFVKDKKPKDAIESYKNLINEYPNSKLAPEAMTELSALYIKQNDASDAVVFYENLVKDHSDSKIAPRALLESAALYQKNLVKNLTSTQSLQKAAETYKSVYDKYPQSEEAPKSLFMSGFIYANDLQNYKKADDIYKLFLEKYPKHQLAFAAKEELNNLGLTPDQILEKSQKKEASK